MIFNAIPEKQISSDTQFFRLVLMERLVGTYSMNWCEKDKFLAF